MIRGIAGIGIISIAAEALLRILVTPTVAVLPDVANDAFDLPQIAVRQIEEGISTAHFSAAGARLTGNRPIAGAPMAVIIGDSYVVAREVADEVTMGSQLEREARDHGVPLNVRQYGWRGATPAQYVLAAPSVRAKWNPRVVIVPLSDDDLDERAIAGAYPYLRVDSTGEAFPVSDPHPQPNVSAREPSVLVTMLVHRWLQLWARAPRRLHRLFPPDPAATSPETAAPSTPISTIPRAVAHALKGAFGDRLLILYLADVRVADANRPDGAEQRLLAACAAEGITCASLRERMRAAAVRGVITRGFSSTTLGVGHMNREGHRLAALELWDMVRPRLAGPSTALAQ